MLLSVLAARALEARGSLLKSLTRGKDIVSGESDPMSMSMGRLIACWVQSPSDGRVCGAL